MRRFCAIVFVLATAFLSAAAGRLPSWRPGNLDIHIINAGRGECSFVIMPDGTTLVIDVGEFYRYKGKHPCVDARPDSLVRPYKVYARYMRHFMPADHERIDYLLLTHYHMDHMGREEAGFERHPEAGYSLFGASALYEELPFDRIYDRSYPEYSGAALLGDTSKSLPEYRDFLLYKVSREELQAFRTGVGPVFEQLYAPQTYLGFGITCYAAGGKLIDGTDFKVTRENAMSPALLLSYGPFDYFTSGDGNNPEVSAAVARAIGRKVEACKCVHHMSNPDVILTEQEVFRSDVMLTTSFYVRDDQPQPSVIRALAGKCDMFFTNFGENAGHLVVRVAPGGSSYMVYVLDDGDFNYRIKAKYGPYPCE